MSGRNMDDGGCEITISAVDGSEHVMFVAAFPGDNINRIASSSGNIYVWLTFGQRGRIGPSTTNE